jgi:anti-sigma-K factor RskA
MSGAVSEERDLLAAEYALRLTEGAELEEARARAARDPEFAAAVAAWEERLQPLADTLPPVEPGLSVWTAIERGTGAAPAAANDNQAALSRRLKRWRLYGAGVTALAASLAAVLAIDLTRQAPTAPDPAPAPAPAGPAPLLVASLSGEGVPNAAAITYHAPTSNLLVNPVRWPEDPTHDHVLWIIPPGGEPVKVGPCCQSGPQRHNIPKELAPHFRARSAIAVSVEPRGGPPAERPSSPFVVRSEFNPI